jgi:hypothetical protein
VFTTSDDGVKRCCKRCLSCDSYSSPERELSLEVNGPSVFGCSIPKHGEHCIFRDRVRRHGGDPLEESPFLLLACVLRLIRRAHLRDGGLGPGIDIPCDDIGGVPQHSCTGQQHSQPVHGTSPSWHRSLLSIVDGFCGVSAAVIFHLDYLEELAQDGVNTLRLHAPQVRPDRLQMVLTEMIEQHRLFDPLGHRQLGR